MKVTVCIGSSCHLKGSREIVQALQQLIAARSLDGKVQLSGAFCMGNCVNGVSVKIDDELFSVQPDNVLTFFEKEIMTRI